MTDSTFDTTQLTMRAATLNDATAIHKLIISYPNELLQRSMNHIVEGIDRFSVGIYQGKIVACATWAILPEIGNPSGATVELQSVAVAQEMRGKHIGEQLISFVIERIKAFKPKYALVLTFAPDFFRHMGFKYIEKTQIIHKIYRGCIYCTKYTDPFTCPEIAMQLDLTQPTK